MLSSASGSRFFLAMMLIPVNFIANKVINLISNMSAYVLFLISLSLLLPVISMSLAKKV